MKITKSQLRQIIKEEISITELESWANEELEPVINQVLQRLGVVERKLKIDPSMAVIKEEMENVLSEDENLGQAAIDAWGKIQNLLISHGEWEKHGGTRAGLEEASKLLTPHMKSLYKILLKLRG